jgi:hypothetical protein
VVEDELVGVDMVELGELGLTDVLVADAAGPLAPGRIIAHAATAAATIMTTTIKTKPHRRAFLRRRRSLRELGVRYRPGSGVMILLERSGRIRFDD